MSEELNQAISEFEPKKRDIEDILIDGLINYVRNGSLFKVNDSSLYTCYDIIYSFSSRLGAYLLHYHNEKIKDIVNECYEKIKDLKALDFIDSFISYTERLNYLFYYMSRIFLYISNNYLLGTDNNNKRIYKQDDISEFSMAIYKEYFFNKLQDKLYNILIELIIKKERNDKTEYKQKIQRIIEIISNMDIIKPKIIKTNNCIWEEKNQNLGNQLIYQQKWFELYQKEIIKFVKEKYENDIEKYSYKEYFYIEIKYINEEIKRQNNYLTEKFHNKLNKIFYDLLIRDYMRNQKEVKRLFEDEKTEMLKMLYEILKSIIPSASIINLHAVNNQIGNNNQNELEGLKILKICFKDYIRKNYISVINNNDLYNYDENSKNIIQESIKIKKKFDEFISSCFNNDNEFIEIKNQEIIPLVKANRSNDDYLPNYVDHCMKQGFINKSEDEVKEIMDEIIFMLKKNIYSHRIINELDKKLFIRLLKKDLSSSNKFEIMFINKFNEAFEFNSSKMKRIMDDFLKNEKVIEDYKQTSINKGNPSGIEFNVCSLPMNNDGININIIYALKFEIPKFLQFCINDFNDYYINKYNSRKLFWFLGLSKLNIEYLYLKNKNISISTLPQLLILLCLEKYNKLSLEKIAELLKCDVRLIMYEVRGLIYNENFNPNAELNEGVILANIDPDKREFKPKTEISINKDFNISNKIFNTILNNEKDSYWQFKIEENKKAEGKEKQIKQFNNYIIQAALTRIMKRRIGQNTTHLILVNETYKEIELFKAKPELIEENIVKLIESHVIRKKNGGRLYEYNA